MTQKHLKKLMSDTHYTRTGGSEDELRCAKYLRACCEELGASAEIEAFPIEMANITHERLTVNGKEYPCKGYLLCGSGAIEAPICYMPGYDPASLSCCSGKIVLLDTGVGYFTYQDMLEAGAVGFITFDGNVNYADNDIDRKELRPYVSCGRKIPGVNINAKSAVQIVKSLPATARIEVSQEEYSGESRNTVAVLPGTGKQYVLFTAHYDSTSLSKGSYDNMSGCIGLLGILEQLAKTEPNHYGAHFVFCGSEERGLRGSKAFAEAHKDELADCVLNVNLDMIGSYMGKFIACVSAEDRLCSYITYDAAIRGWSISARQGVYSSDSTPFADKGVPAVSFARIAGNNVAPIHNRYDTMSVMSPAQLQKDIDYLAAFSDQMVNAAVCPVSREIPDRIKKELDEYLARKRKD